MPTPTACYTSISQTLLYSPVAEAQETAGSILTELVLSPAPSGVAEKAREQVKTALGSLVDEDPDALEMLPAALREAMAGAS